MIEIRLATLELVKKIERGDWTYASGLCVCHHCDRLYFDHASIVNYYWLHQLCDGRLVKL